MRGGRNRRLVASGAALVVTGFIVGLMPVRPGGENCGSVLFPYSYGNFIVHDFCSNARGDRLVWVWLPIIAGVLLVLWGLRTFRGEEQTQPTPSGVSDDAAVELSKSAAMDDLIALRDAGTLTDEEFQRGRDRILGRSNPQDEDLARLERLRKQGLLSEQEYLAAKERQEPTGE